VKRSAAASLAEAQRLLDAAMPFHAHEVLEDAWKAAPPELRALWRGLAQLAVGLTHAARGNPSGASSLLLRGADSISGYAGTQPCGVDVDGLLVWAYATASELQAHPVGPAPDAPRLTWDP
jgi:hypothetical protein